MGRTIFCRPFPVEVFPFEHVDTQNEDRQHQRPENHAHKTEQGQADHHAENRNQRMSVGHLLLQDEADQVVGL